MCVSVGTTGTLTRKSAALVTRAVRGVQERPPTALPAPLATTQLPQPGSQDHVTKPVQLTVRAVAHRMCVPLVQATGNQRVPLVAVRLLGPLMGLTVFAVEITSRMGLSVKHVIPAALGVRRQLLTA